MRKMSLGILLIIVVMFAAVQAQAFNGDRKGFLLNLGVGYGQIGGDWEETESGITSDFKIGAGINSQVALYYTNRVIFKSDELTSDLYYAGMSGVGVSYFLNPKAPSFFFSGAVGLATFASTASGAIADTGMGFSFGAGFEFSQNWIIEGNYMTATIGEGVLDYGIHTMTLTLSWFAY